MYIWIAISNGGETLVSLLITLRTKILSAGLCSELMHLGVARDLEAERHWLNGASLFC